MHTEQQPTGIIRRINWDKYTAFVLLDFAERYDGDFWFYLSAQRSNANAKEYSMKKSREKRCTFIYPSIGIWRIGCSFTN